MEEPATDEPAPAPAAPPWWRTRRALLLGGCVAATMIVLLTGVLARPAAPEEESEAVRTVRDFLTALQQRSPARALEIAGVDTPPTGPQARFLAADAMSDEWEIRSLEEQGTYGEAVRATVVVTIAGPDGSTARSALGLDRDDEKGAWTVARPFAEVRFVESVLRYVDVNGVRVPIEPGQLVETYLLFPGFYRFYGDLPAGLDAHFEDLLLLPGMAVPPVYPTAVAINEVGERLVQRQVEAHIDRCVQSTRRVPVGCPFGAESYAQLPGFSIFWEFGTEVEWAVVEYPVVAAVLAGDHISITDRQRGVVQLRAAPRSYELHDSGLEELGPVVLLTCQMATTGLAATFTAAGEPTIEPFDDYRDTCRRPLSVTAGS